METDSGIIGKENSSKTPVLEKQALSVRFP
jgi:hypothetical protein